MQIVTKSFILNLKVTSGMMIRMQVAKLELMQCKNQKTSMQVSKLGHFVQLRWINESTNNLMDWLCTTHEVLKVEWRRHRTEHSPFWVLAYFRCFWSFCTKKMKQANRLINLKLNFTITENKWVSTSSRFYFLFFCGMEIWFSFKLSMPPPPPPYFFPQIR